MASNQSTKDKLRQMSEQELERYLKQRGFHFTELECLHPNEDIDCDKCDDCVAAWLRQN